MIQVLCLTFKLIFALFRMFASFVADFILSGYDPLENTVNSAELDIWDMSKLQPYFVLIKVRILNANV